MLDHKPDEVDEDTAFLRAGTGRLTPSESRQFRLRIRTVLDEERMLERGSYRARIEHQVRKWRLIHRYVHDHPFPTRTDIPRSDQWRAVIEYARDLGDLNVLDWVLLQVEVAANIERGVREMRPRKSGPCHDQLLEVAADRKRKALAVYKWETAATEGGANSATTRTLTDAILKAHQPLVNGGTENL